MNRSQRLGIRIAKVGTIFLGVVIAGILIASNFDHTQRANRYIEALKADQSTVVGYLPAEQILGDLESRCDQIADGWTLADEMETVESRWESSLSSPRLSLSEYTTSFRALYNAAAAAC